MSSHFFHQDFAVDLDCQTSFQYDLVEMPAETLQSLEKQEIHGVHANVAAVL